MKLAFVNARNQYRFPPVGLTFNTTQKSHHNELKLKRFESTLELDVHHQYLLRSDVDEEVVLGLYSVTHWYLQEYPDLYRDICAVIARIDPGKLVRLLRSAIADLDLGSRENALSLLSNRLLGGRVGLASAIIAFADPDRTALFDEQSISFLLSTNPDEILDDSTLEELSGHPSESLQQACARHAAYCEALRLIQRRLNNERHGWADITGCEMTRFRVLDVSRALYVLVNQDSPS